LTREADVSRFRAWPIALILSSPLAACGTSADVAPAAPRRTATIDLEIGEVDGAGPATFGRISGLALLPDGRLLVLDGNADEARVFDGEGRFRFAFGRSGEGPGEFGGACCVGVDDEGRIWVRDGGNARYDVFALDDTAAQYRFSVRMGHADVNFWAPITFDRRGRLIDIGHRPDGNGLALVRLHTDTAGTVGDSVRIPAIPPESTGVRVITRSSPAGNAMRYLYPPFGPRELIAHGPGGTYAKAVSSNYRIAWFRADGSQLRVIEQEGRTGPPLSVAERERAQESIDADAERFDLSATERFSVPDRKQPLSGLAFDTEGRLWVLLTPAAGAERMAEVRDTTGALVFTAHWPADVDPTFTGVLTDSAALAVRRDSLDVESVVRLRWTGS
jgi:hypothetical protein